MDNSIIITSPDNPTVRQICRLADSAKARREEGLFIAEGLRLCMDAVTSVAIKAAVMTEEFFDKHQGHAETISQKAQKTLIVSQKVFKKMSGTQTPQGVVCMCKIPDTQTSIDKNGKYIALERVADPANLGAVARTAEALGLGGVIVSGDGCDRYNPKALRASMGALMRLPVIEFADFTKQLTELSMPLYACVVHNQAKPISTVDFSGGAIALIGNEANGLTDEAINIATPVNIPMKGVTESLNAATAAAIVMWEMMR